MFAGHPFYLCRPESADLQRASSKANAVLDDGQRVCTFWSALLEAAGHGATKNLPAPRCITPRGGGEMLVSEDLNLGKILVLQLLHHEDSDEGDEADDDEVIAHVAHVKGAD